MNLDKLLMESKTNYKVYTPVKVAREIVAKALSLYFRENKKEKLNKLRAVDLSCGNGNLLIVLLESLIRIHRIYYGVYGYNPKWIEGYDIDRSALKEFKLRAKDIFKKYEVKGRIKLYNLDSLTTDFEKSYNIILGNPPYLGEKNNREIFEKIKNTDFGKKYYEGKMDYLYFFIEKGIDLLEPKGVLSYITTNYWLRADGAKKLRKTIKDETSFAYVNNINKSVFKDALGQHNMIFTIQKFKIENFKLIVEGEKIQGKNSEIFDSKDKISLMNNNSLNFSKSIKEKAHFLLGEKFNINQGIVSGCDKAFVLDGEKHEFKKYLKKFYKNKDIHKYRLDDAKVYILYLDGKIEPNQEVLEYLENFREKLEGRREVKKGMIPWWQLQWSRDENIFTGAKIVARQRNRNNNFALTFDNFYASADVYYISTKDHEINLYYILAYLNSSVFYEWFKLNGKYKGEFLELYATPLKEVPIIYEYNKEKLRYIENLVKEQMKNFSIQNQKKIDDFFCLKIR